MTAPQRLLEAIDRLYEVFGVYARPHNVEFCTHCYDEEEIAYFRSTPLRKFDAEKSRRLIWESQDHWQSTEIYKHYLPRILEALAPPVNCEDIYPEHLFETVRAHGFQRWPASERQAFWDYVIAVDKSLEETDPRAARMWRICAGKLAGGPYPNDGLLSTDAFEEDRGS